jgi:integrase
MGSIFRRKSDGRVIAQLSIGPRSDRRYVSRSCRTRTEAKAELAKLFDEHVTGANLTKLSLGAYLRRWLDESAKPTISANTFRGYDDVLIHLAPIAEIPLAKVTAEDIERCLAGMVTHRGKTRSPASAKTVRNAQVVLRRALGQAEQRGHVRHNVARQVPLRRVPRSTRDALTPDAAKRILEAVAGDDYEAAYALAMIGLRASEILGLARSDVRLEAPASVNVHRQVAGSGKGARMAELKTAASEAPVPLPPFVVTRLRTHLDAQPVPIEDGKIVDSLVFVNRAGLAVNGSWLTRRFAGLVVAAGLPRITLHSLRHGAATLLIGAGAHPRVAQELLRHASSRTTMEIYGHVSAGQQREAVELLEKAIAG